MPTTQQKRPAARKKPSAPTPGTRKKRYSRKVYRRRQLTLLAVLFTLAVVLVTTLILLTNAEKSPDNPAVNTTAPSAATTTGTTQTTAPITDTTTEATTTTTFVLPASASLTVKPVLQNPELPTGCEVTSLTMLLNFYGLSATKTELANNYLPCSSNGGVSYDDYFVGSPYIDNSFGCFPPVIVKTAEAYFEALGIQGYTATDLTGATPDELYTRVAQGTPVAVWATMDMHAPIERVYWNLPDGTPELWYTYEHCLVLTGYDKTAGTVSVCDPLKGATTYDMATFELRYSQLKNRCCIITGESNPST